MFQQMLLIYEHSASKIGTQKSIIGETFGGILEFEHIDSG